MTVGTQLEQAILSVQSASSSLKSFALETQDQQAQQDFEQVSQALDSALKTLQQRQKYIQQQEPQY